MAATSDGLTGFGPFHIDMREGVVFRNGKVIHLRNQVFKALVVLFQRKNQVVTYQELRKLAWGEDTFVSPHTVMVTVRELRRALGNVPHEWVQNVPKRGYLLAAGDGILVRSFASTGETVRHRTNPNNLFEPIHQIPRAPKDLTGRAGKVAELVSLIEEKSEDILGLYGMAGVGKTALAFKIIESMDARYDFHFYVDLKGLTQAPLPSSHVMAAVIHAHYPATSLPRRADELAKLYQSVLYHRHAVLLFDNARDAAQVNSILPPVGNLVIVTSRTHISLPGICSREVTCLLPDDAETLLLRIEPRIGIHAQQIAKLCACLPLALRASGSTISETVDLDPTEYVEQLSNLQSRLALKDPTTNVSVESSLALSYQFLGTEELRRCFRLLAVFPSSFNRAAAASVLGLRPVSARDVLAILVKHSLVSYDASVSQI